MIEFNEQALEKFQDHSVPPTDADKHTPPSSWPIFIHNEYQSLPKYLKICVKFFVIILAVIIAFDYGSHHLQSFFCQWWPNINFCP